MLTIKMTTLQTITVFWYLQKLGGTEFVIPVSSIFGISPNIIANVLIIKPI